ncbi:hypothetical protein [Pseudomonas nitroreducens]|uniref:Uncharacterized protein n=1 Tax=Pseudomonas nitroreducens TaxID=46680 RepID=A0A6G6IX24_PSENT|nr:hypothetical protein [Pseudomonas nitroreducens]QIE86781.1 hypothetical protein G5B91_11065 [Pseudomonas nitroreducens]
MAVLSQTIGQEIADALGISMKGITGIKIELKTNEVVSVDVSYYPEREQVEECFDVIKRYELVKREQTAKERCENKFFNALSFRGQPDLTGWREKIEINVAAAKQRIALMADRALAPRVGFTTTQIMGAGLARNYR